MKLLMTADAVGGVWRYAVDLATALRPHGVETVIAVMGPASLHGHPRESGDPSLALRDEADGCAEPDHRSWVPAFAGMTVLRTQLPLDWLCASAEPVLAAGSAIAELARALGADLVHLNSPALAARARFDQPVVAVAHGCVATWWEAARDAPLAPGFGWHAALTREGLLAADALVAPSRAFADAVRRRYRLRAAPRAVHNGRAPMAPPDAGPSPSVARPAFTAGRLWDEVKRTALLDRVAALTPIRAAGAITGPHGETVTTADLTLLGLLGEAALARELAARPVFVSAASFEPFGLAVLEAAQAGCPLVLSDIATFRELWDGAALFVAGENPRAWADAIARANAEHGALGEAARVRAARYTPAAMAAGMMAIYAEVLEGAGSRKEGAKTRRAESAAGTASPAPCSLSPAPKSPLPAAHSLQASPA